MILLGLKCESVQVFMREVTHTTPHCLKILRGYVASNSLEP